MDRPRRGKSSRYRKKGARPKAYPEGPIQVSPRDSVCCPHTHQRRPSVRSIAFPYTRLSGHFVPIIPVTLFGRNTSSKTEAYVDSGAFCSIFHSEILVALQLRKSQGRLRMLKAADGNFIPAYLFRLSVQIDDVKIRAPVAFSDRLSVGFNLLGRQTIFSSFEEIAFREREKKVVFRCRV